MKWNKSSKELKGIADQVIQKYKPNKVARYLSKIKARVIIGLSPLLFVTWEMVRQLIVSGEIDAGFFLKITSYIFGFAMGAFLFYRDGKI